jgi:hypothetical protein
MPNGMAGVFIFEGNPVNVFEQSLQFPGVLEDPFLQFIFRDRPDRGGVIKK